VPVIIEALRQQSTWAKIRILTTFRHNRRT
jgi:hypothetical protein